MSVLTDHVFRARYSHGLGHSFRVCFFKGCRRESVGWGTQQREWPLRQSEVQALGPRCAQLYGINSTSGNSLAYSWPCITYTSPNLRLTRSTSSVSEKHSTLHVFGNSGQHMCSVTLAWTRPPPLSASSQKADLCFLVQPVEGPSWEGRRIERWSVIPHSNPSFLSWSLSACPGFSSCCVALWWLQGSVSSRQRLCILSLPHLLPSLHLYHASWPGKYPWMLWESAEMFGACTPQDHSMDPAVAIMDYGLISTPLDSKSPGDHRA